MMSHNLCRHGRPARVAALLPTLVFVLLCRPATADEGGWTFAADAAAGASLAADGPDFASADSAALWQLSANFLHRYDAEGWGLVLSDSIDFSGLAAAAAGTGGTAVLPSFTPTITVHEAYGRLDFGDWGQLFVGKRRMGLGIGTVFAPGDLVDPRSGFWDQKTGFRGLDLAASLGSDVALRLAASLDRNFEAWAAGMRAKSADAQAAADLAAAKASGGKLYPDALIQAAAGLADAAYASVLDGAAGPADPRLVTWAASVDAQLGGLELALAGVYRPDAVARPSLGLSYDLAGIVLQAEGAAELSGDGAASLDSPEWYGTAGAHWTVSDDEDSLSVFLDYDYNGRAGLLANSHYLLPWISYTRNEVLNVYARALVALEDPSALVALGLTLYPAQGFDLEFTVSFCSGPTDGEFSTFGTLVPLPSPGAGKLTTQAGLAARVHF